MTVPFCSLIRSIVHTTSSCSTSTSALSLLRFLKNYSSRKVGVTHCGLNLHFPKDSRCWAPFFLYLFPFLYLLRWFFAKLVFLLAYIFFFLAISYRRFLYIQDSSKFFLSNTDIANIFSLSVCYALIFKLLLKSINL